MKTVLFSMLLILPAIAARAEDTNAAALRIVSACREDLHKYCRPSPAGGPIKCLEDHKDQVAPDCKTALGGLKGATVPTYGKPPAGRKGKPKSCLPEFTKACAGAKSKEFHACLKEHRKEFSDFCKHAVDADEASQKKPS